VRKLVAAGAGEWYITSTALTQDITTWCLDRLINQRTLRYVRAHFYDAT
jgi:hypothetical protein